MPPSLRSATYGSVVPASRTTTAARCSIASLSVFARDAVSSMRSRVSEAICTAIMPATTNTTSAVTPATCFALMLNRSMLAGPNSRSLQLDSAARTSRTAGVADSSVVQLTDTQLRQLRTSLLTSNV